MFPPHDPEQRHGRRGSKRAGAVATAEATERFALPIKDKVRGRAELE